MSTAEKTSAYDQPARVRETRTGYRSRGLNGPPYFNTSFKHFLTVDSLLACRANQPGQSAVHNRYTLTIGMSSSDTGSLEDSSR